MATFPLNRVICIRQIVIPKQTLMRSFFFPLMKWITNQAASCSLSVHGSAGVFFKDVVGKAELGVAVSGGRTGGEKPRRSGRVWTYCHCKWIWLTVMAGVWGTIPCQFSLSWEWCNLASSRGTLAPPFFLPAEEDEDGTLLHHHWLSWCLQQVVAG